MTEKSIVLKIGNGKYRIASDDNYLPQMRSGVKASLVNLTKTLLGKNSFEPKMVALFQKLVKDTDVVIDIGANIGCTSILFGELAHRVLSFEHSPTTFAFLSRNIKQSGRKNIEVYNYALGADNMDSQITYSPSNRSEGFISDKIAVERGHITEQIQISKLDDKLHQLHLRRVDFIKIDVEGFEKDVLTGSRVTLERFQPIVVLELNHWCLNAFQRITIPDFFDYLLSTFPLLYAVEGSHYVNLRDESDRYMVMYEHIINSKFSNLVAAFKKEQLESFLRISH